MVSRGRSPVALLASAFSVGSGVRLPVPCVRDEAASVRGSDVRAPVISESAGAVSLE